MEGRKKLIFPAMAAVVLHGLLFSFKLPKQEMLKPILKAAPIEIKISSVFLSKNIPKKVEIKNEETVPKSKLKNKVVSKRIVKPPIVEPVQPKKKKIVPELISEELSVAKIENKIDHQKPSSENQLTNQPISGEITNTVQSENSVSESEEIFSKEVIYKPPIQKKAEPMYRQNSQPAYPTMAKRRGYEGELLLSILVDTAGKVSQLKVKHSSGHFSLDRAALKAVSGWLFTPAIEDGKFVAMWVEVPIIFQLK